MEAAEFPIRSLSALESRVVLVLAEQNTREITRRDIIDLLKVSPEAADHVIRSLRKKGWLERASWGKYLLIPPDQGPEALGESNVFALASQIADPYYVGYGSAASHYGMTTQHRNVIWLVTPLHLRDRRLLNTEVRIVNLSRKKFFGFSAVNVLGYQVMMSDREKTALDCIDRPDLAGGISEAAYILARACRNMDWEKVAGYLDQIGSIALVRKFGWLVDHTGADIPPELRAMLLDTAGKGRSTTTLGPKAPAKDTLGTQSAWKLRVNISERDLADSAGLAKRHKVSRER
ncbi:MAG: type IV toxin-antitoxin system AbiEi family antitoxin domain-containing protein [Pseudomonadales bacterium]